MADEASEAQVTRDFQIFGSGLIIACPLIVAWARVWLIERYRARALDSRP